MAKESLSDRQILLGQIDSSGDYFGIMIEIKKHQCSTTDGKEVFDFSAVFCYLPWVFISHKWIEVPFILGRSSPSIPPRPFYSVRFGDASASLAKSSCVRSGLFTTQ